MSLDIIKNVKLKDGRCKGTLHYLVEHIASHIRELPCFYYPSGQGCSACDLFVQDLLLDKEVYATLRSRHLRDNSAILPGTVQNVPINDNYVLMHELLIYAYSMSISEANFYARVLYFLRNRGIPGVIQRYEQCKYHGNI